MDFQQELDRIENNSNPKILYFHKIILTKTTYSQRVLRKILNIKKT